jgi:hypothetical protein
VGALVAVTCAELLERFRRALAAQHAERRFLAAR